MWLRQVQIFELTDKINYAPEKIAQQLEPLAFTSCLPSMPSSIGWAAPLEVEDAALVHGLNGYIVICMQIEEKILPATVVRQELNEKVKKIEARDERRVRSKEKLSLKDEVVMTLLPRAFTKINRLYAYIDTKNQMLILGTTNAKKTEQFMLLFKKCVTEGVRAYEINKIAPLLTHWVKTKEYPQEFSIEEACLLQDANQQSRTIRCQHQDLFAPSIQSLIKDGCEVKQLAVCWQDRVNFIFSEDFAFRGIQYQEDVLTAANEIESETKEQQFDADFFIMTETLAAMFKDLLKVVSKAALPEEMSAA
jgi:recombination associated protein RdgC